jgi:hypothetical protein
VSNSSILPVLCLYYKLNPGMNYFKVGLLLLMLISSTNSCVDLFPSNQENMIQINQQSDYLEVVLSNSRISARYTSHNPSAMANLFINEFKEDVAGGTNWKYLDYLETRGSLKYANLTECTPVSKSVELIWENASESKITIYTLLPLLKIQYYSGPGTMIDLGANRGTYNGCIAALDTIHLQEPEVEGDIPYTDYKGFFIGGVYNRETGRGFGRLFPVHSIQGGVRAISDSSGLEYTLHGDLDDSEPITSYIYTVTKGDQEIIETGKTIVDWHLNMQSNPKNRTKIESLVNQLNRSI